MCRHANKQFYPLDCIELRVMPPVEKQRAHFTRFQQRVITLMRETLNTPHPLTYMEAEQIVWQ